MKINWSEKYTRFGETEWIILIVLSRKRALLLCASDNWEIVKINDCDKNGYFCFTRERYSWNCYYWKLRLVNEHNDIHCFSSRFYSGKISWKCWRKQSEKRKQLRCLQKPTETQKELIIAFCDKTERISSKSVRQRILCLQLRNDFLPLRLNNQEEEKT